MKLLFMHNTIPEYRIEFMKYLSRKIDTEFAITSRSLGMKTYNLEIDADSSGLKIIYLPENHKSYLSIKKMVSDEKVDIVILPPADNLTQYLIGLYSLMLAKKNKKKIIYWTEKWEPESFRQPVKKRIKNKVQSIMINSLAIQSDICIAAGSKSKEYYKKIGVPDYKIRIAYDSSMSPKSGLQFDIREKYGIPQNAKIVLYLGRLIKRKGCEILIDAFNKISFDFEEVYLLICGEGEYSPQCEFMVKKLGMKNVIFAGKINPVDRGLYYAQSTVFVLPSYSLDGVIEAWGLTLNEAMEFGLPAVATTAVGSAYDLLDGTNGLMVEEKNSEELAKAILEIINNERKIPFQQNCYNTAQKYSVVKMADNFADIIYSLQ